MPRFYFNTDVILEVIEEMNAAEKFIKIAVFQIHSRDIFDVLLSKLKQDVKIEIFTLPYDSINDNLKDEVIPHIEELIKHGAILHFCRWNIGDPERTSTAVGRWYSFHGKFIVTDKSAICLSANLTGSKELDALLVFNENEKIAQFDTKFKELIDLFITEYNGYEGSIRAKILSSNVNNSIDLFKQPRVIETDTHFNNWITDYPSSILPTHINIEDRLYLVPFEGKGREIIESIINEASDFVYLAAESFTDPKFPLFLRKVITEKQLNFKILCASKSMDFSDRINIMFREFLALNIKINTSDNIHAKLLITDKHLVISSINLNKMNLGFESKSNLWRENTETLLICRDSSIIKSAKNQYEEQFENSVDIRFKLTEKIDKYVTQLFSKTFDLRTNQEAKSILSKHILGLEVETKKIILKVGKITAQMMELYNRRTVRKKDITSALILYYLSESKLNYYQIIDKLKGLERQVDISPLLDELLSNGLIEKEKDMYKINIENIF